MSDGVAAPHEDMGNRDNAEIDWRNPQDALRGGAALLLGFVLGSVVMALLH